MPTDEQGRALAALDSGRWTVEPGTSALSSHGDGPGPSDALGLVRELRVRDWIDADGEVTLVGPRRAAAAGSTPTRLTASARRRRAGRAALGPVWPALAPRSARGSCPCPRPGASSLAALLVVGVAGRVLALAALLVVGLAGSVVALAGLARARRGSGASSACRRCSSLRLGLGLVGLGLAVGLSGLPCGFGLPLGGELAHSASAPAGRRAVDADEVRHAGLARERVRAWPSRCRRPCGWSRSGVVLPARDVGPAGASALQASAPTAAGTMYVVLRARAGARGR